MADDATGTPVTHQEGGAASASGTPDSSQAGGAAVEETPEALKARIAELESIRKQDLARLSSGEEARRKLEELEAQMSRPSTPPAGHDSGGFQNEHAARVWESLVERDPETAQVVAAAVQAAQMENAQTRAEIRWYRELDSVPAGDREAVRLRAIRDKVAPSVAHAFVKAERFDSERERLAEQARKLQEAEDRMKRGVVSTTATPAPAPPSSDGITQSEYARLAREAVSSAAARKRLQEVDDARDAGRMKIRPG